MVSEGAADDAWLRTYLEGQFSGLHNEIEDLRVAQKETQDLLTLEGPNNEPCLMAQVRENTAFRKASLDRTARAAQTRIGFVVSLVLLAVSTALNVFWAWARGQAPN
jgi:hypothetical protein